jgi:excisionase family DNA binding protein
MDETQRVIEEGWVTTGEAAEATGYSEAYLRRLAREGHLPGARAGRDWFINLEAALAHRRHMEALGPAKHNPWREDLAEEGRGRGCEQQEGGK